MNENPLENLAGQVADHEPIDWDATIGGAANERDRRLIRQLHLVESIARVHSSSEKRPAASGPAIAEAPTLAGKTSDAASLMESSGPVIEEDAPTPTLTGGRWGHLEIQELLGSGAFGEVYRAWDPRLDREVALKLLRGQQTEEEAGKTAVEEGRLLARLRHPNVVTVYGAEVHDGRVGIWMEFIRGRSLEHLLHEQGALGAREAALIGIDLCRALAAVHRAKLLHRDVKTENVLREEGGRIVLTDFGAGIELTREMKTGISGTRLYMAPELFNGVPASPGSDIYALGVLLYRLVTDSYPLDARNWSELLGKITRREMNLLRDQRPDLPEAFIRSVERALAWEPSARFATAGQMEQSLNLALGAEAPPPALPSSERAEATSSRSRPLRVAAAGLVAAGLVVAGILIVPTLVRRPAVTPAQGDSPRESTGTAEAATYSVEASLYRIPKGSSVREKLEPGAQLSLGDSLTLDFQASAPVHVYVINEDEAGHSYALFPLPGFEPKNPLSPATRHMLPGVLDGRQRSWTVDSPGGREHLLVLASPTRLVEFEAEMNALARPGQTAVSLPESARVRLRGLGGLSDVPSSVSDGASAGRLFEMAQKLADGEEVAHGVWMRRIEIENPRGK